MLSVNFASVADHAMPAAKWVHRMLWKWSPWHLQVRMAQWEDDYWRACKRAERERRHRNQLIDYIERERDLPVIATGPFEVLAEEDPRLMVTRIDVILPKWSFMVTGRSFEHACCTDDLVDLMARDYAQRMARNIETALADILRQKAAARC